MDGADFDNIEEEDTPPGAKWFVVAYPPDQDDPYTYFCAEKPIVSAGGRVISCIDIEDGGIVEFHNGFKVIVQQIVEGSESKFPQIPEEERQKLQKIGNWPKIPNEGGRGNG